MKQAALFLCLTGFIPVLADGQDRDQRIADLERQPTEAKGTVAALQKTIESLSTQVQEFKNHPSFEDDAVNGRFQITWGIL
jgi:hypothetical protein